MRLSDRVESRIVQALHELFTEKEIPPPDHEFFIVNMPGKGMRAMIMLIVPVSDDDNTAQADDIDPYATPGEYMELLTRLHEAAQLARNGVVLAGQPGLGRRSAGGLLLPD